MANESIPMTKEGYEKKKADLDRMTNVEMIEVAKRIATAREMGDSQRKRGVPCRPRGPGNAASPHRLAQGFLEPGHDRG